MVMWNNGHNSTTILALFFENDAIETEINLVSIDHTKTNHKTFREYNRRTIERD